jgi:hypothetical protein
MQLKRGVRRGCGLSSKDLKHRRAPEGGAEKRYIGPLIKSTRGATEGLPTSFLSLFLALAFATTSLPQLEEGLQRPCGLVTLPGLGKGGDAGLDPVVESELLPLSAQPLL